MEKILIFGLLAVVFILFMCYLYISTKEHFEEARSLKIGDSVRFEGYESTIMNINMDGTIKIELDRVSAVRVTKIKTKD